MILVSACLLGENCKYNGGNNRSEAVIAYINGHEYLAFCPEVAGKLPIPRPPVELPQGDAAAVLTGKAKAVNREGQDVSASLIAGAEQALQLCKQHGVTLAILREGSPSCGVHCVYDGSFSGKKIPGSGVTASLLRAAGIKVLSDGDIAGQS